jgi:anti-sigma factor RsiW
MHRAHHHDHDLHALVDHQLDDDGARTALGRLAADPHAAARCAAYAAQHEVLTSLREGLALSLPAPSLAQLQDELRATVQHQEQMRLAVAVGGAMALLAVIGYVSWPHSTQQAGHETAI